MQALLMKMGGTLGSMVLGMMKTFMTKQMIRFVILKMMDYAVSKYENSAKKTKSKDDDKIAEILREVLVKLETNWK